MARVCLGRALSASRRRYAGLGSRCWWFSYTRTASQPAFELEHTGAGHANRPVRSVDMAITSQMTRRGKVVHLVSSNDLDKAVQSGG